jgi:predicted metal-binding membrane protein
MTGFRRTRTNPATLGSIRVGAPLAVVAGIGWVVVIERSQASANMRGFDAAGFLVGWAGMVAAMMFPTIEPMVRTYRAVLRDVPAARRGWCLMTFVSAYVVVWVLAGIAALGLWMVGRRHPVVAGSLVAMAGLYQLGMLKTRCLRWCRSPLGFMAAFGGDGGRLRGAAALGSRHGVVCLGCCVGLMVGLTGAGVMALNWLAALGLLMVVEKVHRAGPMLARVSGVTLLALGMGAVVVPLSQLTSEATGLVALGSLAVLAWVSGRRRDLVAVP